MPAGTLLGERIQHGVFQVDRRELAAGAAPGQTPGKLAVDRDVRQPDAGLLAVAGLHASLDAESALIADVLVKELLLKDRVAICQ